VGFWGHFPKQRLRVIPLVRRLGRCFTAFAKSSYWIRCNCHQLCLVCSHNGIIRIETHYGVPLVRAAIAASRSRLLRSASAAAAAAALGSAGGGVAGVAGAAGASPYAAASARA
jgi:hypothetical protein